MCTKKYSCVNNVHKTIYVRTSIASTQRLLFGSTVALKTVTTQHNGKTMAMDKSSKVHNCIEERERERERERDKERERERE